MSTKVLLSSLVGAVFGLVIMMTVLVMAAERNSAVPLPSFWGEYVGHHLLGFGDSQ